MFSSLAKEKRLKSLIIQSNFANFTPCSAYQKVLAAKENGLERPERSFGAIKIIYDN